MWKEQGEKPIIEFLLLVFAISWGTEGLIIALEQMNILPDFIMQPSVMVLIGFGAGLAPTYAIYIMLKKRNMISGIKDFYKKVVDIKNLKITIITLFSLMGFQLIKCLVTESSLGNPWYFFVLFIPLMIFGGGLEEIGWRGFLQPALEEKISFIPATLITGIIWAVWHIPLWFVQSANQGSFNFLSFTIYCITLSFTFALLYRVSNSVIAVVILHAWCNVVLGGMYTFDSLTNIPGIITYILYGIEILFVIAIVYFIQLKKKKYQEGVNKKTLNLMKSNRRLS